MRQLSQLEKRLLRIIALQQQMEATGAVGDFAKTINYTANQLKQLQETFKEIGRWIGQYFMFALQPVVEYTLSFAIAIRELLKYINVLNGYEYEDSGAKGFFGDEQSKIEGANEALEEYKTNLLGFDTLNVLGDQNATPTEDVSFLTDVIMEYQSKLTNVKNDANDIAKSMLEWLGYTYDAEGNLTTMGVKATLLKLAFEELKKSLANLLPSLKKSFKEGGATLVKIFKNLAPPIFEIISMVADTLAPILDELIPPVLSLITELADTLVPIIDELISIIKQILNMATSFLPIIKQIINALSGVIKPIMAGILNIVQILTPFVTEIITIVSSVLEPTLKMVLPIIETILNVVNMLLPVIIMIVDEIVDYLEPVLQIIEPIFKSIFDVVDSLLPLIEVIVSLISDKWAKSLKDNTGYAKAFKEIIESMLNILTVIVETALSGIATYLDIFTGGFQTVKVLIDGMKSSMDALLKGDFKGFIKAFTEMGEQLKLIWGNVWKSIKGMFSNIINGIAQGFASFVNIFADIVNGLTSKLSGAWEFLGIPAIPEIPTWNPSPIELATGGVITQPTHALVGEYKGASSNPEIVTPENLMREVFLDSMLPVVQAIVNGNSQVVTAINNKDTNVYMNGRKVSENLYNDLENVAIRKGKTLAFSR